MADKNTYYTRYRDGHHAAVMAELTSLEGGVRVSPLYEQALNVAKEFVDRSYANLQTLRASLLALGYRFLRPDSVLVEATPDDVNQLRELETRLGQFPVIVRAWYERMACVDFRQDGSQLYARPDGPSSARTGVEGLGCNCAFVFLRLSECLELRERLFSGNTGETAAVYSDAPESLLPLGSLASNCDPKGLWLPHRGFDAVLYNDGAGDVTFANEVRHAFYCGGFPFWNTLTKKRRFSSPVGHVPDYQTLLPILSKGLIPV